MSSVHMWTTDVQLQLYGLNVKTAMRRVFSNKVASLREELDLLQYLS